MFPDAYVKEEAPPLPPGAFFKEDGIVSPLSSDAVVKQEHEDIVTRRRTSQRGGRPKRQRSI